AGEREVLAEARAAVPRLADKAIEVLHRARRQVVQNHERPGLRRDLRHCARYPTIGVFPVARDRIPEHAGEAFAFEKVERRLVQEPLVQVPAAAERAEVTAGMRE